MLLTAGCQEQCATQWSVNNREGPNAMSQKPEHFAVWTEIPVTDMDRAIAFYNEVFDMDLKKDETGPNPMAVFPTQNPDTGVSGHLYPDKLENALQRVTTAGGEVLSEAITIPPGRFAYCLDPDGNSIGIFEYKS